MQRNRGAPLLAGFARIGNRVAGLPGTATGHVPLAVYLQLEIHSRSWEAQRFQRCNGDPIFLAASAAQVLKGTPLLAAFARSGISTGRARTGTVPRTASCGNCPW